MKPVVFLLLLRQLVMVQKGAQAVTPQGTRSKKAKQRDISHTAQ
jgi:hypothetical protein